MPFKFALGAAVAAAALVTGLALAQTIPGGYLGDKGPDTIAILPPAPVKGTPAYDADRKVFRNTRKLKGTPRWDLAVNDVAQAPLAMLKDFSCAVGVELTPQNVKGYMAVMGRAARDVGPVVNRPKEFYQRRRPYLIDDGEICLEATPSLAKSPDYPSGHTTWGWTWGMILAQLAPDRSSQILARARAYGESRAVCGVHNASAIDAGRTAGSALVATLNGNEDFRRDMAVARVELDALRASGAPAPKGCEAEARLIAKTPW